MEDCENKLNELIQVLGKEAELLRWKYVTETDSNAKCEIESQINFLHGKNFGFDKDIVLVPPSIAESHGDYNIGAVQFNGNNLYPFGLRNGELTQHVLIAGRSGSGKSNLMLYLSKQFTQQLMPFILFSFKREYRPLVQYFINEKKEILLFTCGRKHADFHFNPLSLPKGADRETWINLVAEAIASVYFLKEGAISFLRSGLSYIYEKHKNPKILHLREWIETNNSKGRAGEWLASSKRVVEALCFGRINEVLNSNDAIDLETLLDKRVILELDNFNDDDRTFVIQMILRWLYQYALENFPRNILRYILMVDEAHHLFTKNNSHETFSDSLIRKVRELGISLILGDQHPSLLSLPALGNTFTTISLNLKTQADVNAIGGSMLLEAEQKRFIGILPRGYAIVRMQDRYLKPFLIQIPKVSLPTEPMSDEMVTEYMKPYLLSRSSIPALIDGETNAFRPIDNKDDGTLMKQPEQAFILSVLNHPFISTRERYSQLHLSVRHGIAIKNNLVLKGYLKPVLIELQNSKIMLFDLTEKAFAYFEKNNIPFIRSMTEGGIEHRYVIHFAKTHLENNGYAVETESKTKTGKYIDVVAKKSDVSIALLIETGKSDFDKNIQAAHDEGFTNVRIIASNKDVLKKKYSVPVLYFTDLPRGI